MSIAAEPPKGAPQAGFRPSQLLYDTRYRSLTIQTIVLVALAALLVGVLATALISTAQRPPAPFGPARNGAIVFADEDEVAKLEAAPDAAAILELLGDVNE